jgi:hypothetical protein
MRISHLLLLLLILVILSIIGILMLNQKKEHFETNSNILVEPVMISKDEIINGFMTDLSGKDIRNVIANATFLHPQTSGYIAQYMKDGSIKYGVISGYDRKAVDLSSEKFKDVSSIETYIYAKDIKKVEDPSNAYIIYIDRLPKNFIASNDKVITPVSSIPKNIKSVAEFISHIKKPCDSDSSCNGFYTVLDKNNMLTTVLIKEPINPRELRPYPLKKNEEFVSYLFIKNDPKIIDMKDIPEPKGKCLNITITSKDVGKDCFEQLWAQIPCKGPVPEYSDRFKALSYEELNRELLSTDCYTKTQDIPKKEEKPLNFFEKLGKVYDTTKTVF